MHILRIEHQIRDFDSWKAAFDADPVGRALRRAPLPDLETDDPNYVMIDLEFDSPSEAEAMRETLRRDV